MQQGGQKCNFLQQEVKSVAQSCTKVSFMGYFVAFVAWDYESLLQEIS